MEAISFKNVFINDDEPYQEFLQVFPLSDDDKNYGYADHVNLSSYSFELLSRKSVQMPMKFRLTTDKYVTYCSVQEFTSPTGTIGMPKWIMEKLELKIGDYVRIENIALRKAKVVTVRLLDKTLLEVKDIKEILEHQLNKYIVLAEGDRVPILYRDYPCQIEIVKCEPDPVVDINNTNVSIDFAPMYEDEEEKPEEEVLPASEEMDEDDTPKPKDNFAGVGHRLKYHVCSTIKSK